MATHNLTENYTCSLAFAAQYAFKPFHTSVPNSVLEKFWGASNKLLSAGAEFEFWPRYALLRENFMDFLLKVTRGNNGTRPQRPRVLTPCTLLMNLKKKFEWTLGLGVA